ncbi:protein VAPYRIN [Phoenix dactylifera]|uniref:Protein VAPYRIN n=1 Tax=Phoenix dactylifera TaxID=42345 RepID=A0A8B8ZCF8_PHODC|nr:protein VAPYRIN [Phoenix dactylifera]
MAAVPISDSPAPLSLGSAWWSLNSFVESAFESAMLGEWEDAADLYNRFEEVRVATIIRTGDTLLHLAVSSRVEGNVKLLTGRIPRYRSRKILGMGNKSGDTPLHLAAALGMRKACLDMARRCPELLTQVRNEHGETPLFKAARHGQRETFRAMQRAALAAGSSLFDLGCCRKSGGDTVLHVALLEEHYGT